MGILRKAAKIIFSFFPWEIAKAAKSTKKSAFENWFSVVVAAFFMVPMEKVNCLIQLGFFC